MKRLLPKRRSRSKKPVEFLYPLSIEKRYAASLEKMVSEIMWELLPIYQKSLKSYVVSDALGDSIKRAGELAVYSTFNDVFVRKYVNITDYFVGKLAVWSTKEAIQAYKQLFGIPKVEYSKKIEKAVSKYIKNNSEMITSLVDETIKRVEKFVKKEIREGTRNEELAKIIMKSGEVSKSRARFIARDQTAKINGELTALRQTEAGGRWYMWRTTRDEVVRPSHAALSNKICSWDDNTIYADSYLDAKKGKWKYRADIGAFEGIPGFDYRCRCTAEMVIEDILDRLDQGEKIGPVSFPMQN